VKVFLASIFAQVILNPYVFRRGWQAIPPKRIWRIPFALFFIVELLLFFTGYCFYKSLPDGVMNVILQVCGTWYVCLLYLVMPLLAIEIIRLSNRIRPWLPPKLRWKKARLTLFFVLTLGVGALMFHARHAVMHPVVKHIYIEIPRGEGNRLDSLTVVMMSDIHIGPTIGKKQVQRYVALSNAQHPDLVVLVGDLVDYDLRAAGREHIEDDLRQLEAPSGVFAVNGNHEYRANRFAKWRWIAKTGATLLADTAILINDSFYLIGRDDYINKKRKPLQAIMEGLRKDKPAIMLDHQPWSFVEATMNGIDLGLYGHTHYGQLWPYPLIMHLIYECPYGYYRRGDSQFYVSSGIGIAGPPYRVGTVSELVVLHIRFR
jgi:predicted MPP superfamily phosphohydrolase